MVTVDPSFIWGERASRRLVYLVAEDEASGQIIGTVTGIDHCGAFGDTEGGSSLWALAVDPQTTHPGVGHALVVHLIEHFMARGRSFIDLSVMHDNAQAIRLYEKLGFSRVPVFCIKRKNSFNEPLFIAQPPDVELNPYAAIIVREARRRGIAVHVLDADRSYFELSFGGRTIVCRESLSELTTAIAMSRCDDKRVTHQLLSRAGLRVPAQRPAGTPDDNREFLEAYRRIVVKPCRGEQGHGVSVDLRSAEEVEQAVVRARERNDEVILEELVEGLDLRVIVIDYRVVAAAVRRPPEVIGTGEHSIASLIDKQSRRRSAATGGESRIPIDAETERCVGAAGYRLETVLESGKTVPVRKTANLHTGGTIHDVTDELHPALIEVAKRAAEVLDIPVVGLDLTVPSVRAASYAIIEANERPGLANHEPQPTAERFVDLLFPQTAS
jgi:GNAT-family acetyltransferase (TIGR03103 family)